MNEGTVHMALNLTVKVPLVLMQPGRALNKEVGDWCKQSVVVETIDLQSLALGLSEIFIPARKLVRWDALLRRVSVEIAVIHRA